jgi:hypothetical protein
MNKQEIDTLVEKYSRGDGFDPHFPYDHQYDDRSADINYALVRHFKPKKVVEFGTRNGRCTHDILKALLKNEKSFVYKAYELNDAHREKAQQILKKKFPALGFTIRKNIMEADDIPDGIDYLFVDNYHDIETTAWVFNTLIKKCKPGALVHFHDIPIYDDFKIGKETFPETHILVDLHRTNELPLEKLYWTWEEGNRMESTWWKYKPL